MKQNIGIYTASDWAGTRDFAAELRAAGDCTVRIRNGAMFTAEQREEFDVVYVRGDFPAVVKAYPSAIAGSPSVSDEPVAAPSDDAAAPSKPKKTKSAE